MLVVSPGPMSLPFPIKNIIYKHPIRCWWLVPALCPYHFPLYIIYKHPIRCWWLVPALCPYHFPSKTSYINIPQDVGG